MLKMFGALLAAVRRAFCGHDWGLSRSQPGSVCRRCGAQRNTGPAY